MHRSGLEMAGQRAQIAAVPSPELPLIERAAPSQYVRSARMMPCHVTVFTAAKTTITAEP
eukprot:640209-Rhodomonas_salina.1